MIIETAKPEDVSLIADAIIAAIGDDLTMRLAGADHTRSDVHALFKHLAAREDTQYSYLNSRIARDSDGSAMGVCISYDGADLIRLRRPFFAGANASLGWDIKPEEADSLPGECQEDEFYLDTIMTLPQYRGRGVARALIDDAAAKAAMTGKPLGLLCDFDNSRALRLYESAGFRHAGTRPFAGHEMYHLQRD